MPLYSYICTDCRGEHTELAEMAEPAPACRFCQKNSLRQLFCGASLSVGQEGAAEVVAEPKKDNAPLPWWRSGKVDHLPKMEKPLDLSKVKDTQKYILKGETS